ncbi:unnamed protein product [Phytomonas sp. Hart1]|nr:unnamed protein product [Phytomonas sp. Hart1]|eukprot:CCW67305.1 unnamed protein product [Phytomonas sp. isolate Hart1]
MADLFPEFAAEYRAAGAANVIPVETLSVDAGVVAAWACGCCGEVWRCAVFVRCICKTECPSCTARHHPTLTESHPELIPFWDPIRNDPFLTPERVEGRSGARAHWRCPSCGTTYTARIRDRVRGKAECPSCTLSHAQSADLLAREEDVLRQEWHPLKNGDLRLDQVQMRDQRRLVWWLCTLCGNEWEATLNARLSRTGRTKGKVCPSCKGRGVDLS